jgi:AcrR family transcriptional regulator
MPEPPLAGRRGQAARNDQLILEAAREVFVADPAAPIGEVAERAGVGIAAIYRRFASKEDLLRTLCRDGLATYVDIVEAAVADDGDPWAVFAQFMHSIVEADTHSLTISLAGTFTPTEDLGELAAKAQTLNVELLDRTKAARVVRQDLVVDDLSWLFEQIAAIRGTSADRTRQLRRRYLAVHLAGIRADAAAEPLPGPPPTWEEQASRWTPR